MPSDLAMQFAKAICTSSDSNNYRPPSYLEIAASLDAFAEQAIGKINPCTKIFDHKWLDPDCIETGCKSLFFVATTIAQLEADALKMYERYLEDDNNEFGDPTTYCASLSKTVLVQLIAEFAMRAAVTMRHKDISALRAVTFESGPKPSLMELEEMLNSPAPAVHINTDGSIGVGSSEFARAADYLVSLAESA